MSAQPIHREGDRLLNSEAEFRRADGLAFFLAITQSSWPRDFYPQQKNPFYLCQKFYYFDASPILPLGSTHTLQRTGKLAGETPTRL
jgi:hypothetical protein